MLSYLNSGIREYHNKPQSTYRRGVWEFQAVISGSISPVFHSAPSLDFRNKTLWVFPPDSIHGWKGLKDSPAEILVFHFSTIAEELEKLFREKKFLSIDLSEKEISVLKEDYDLLFREYSDMGDLYSLKSRITSDRLSLLVCTKVAGLSSGSRIYDNSIVDNAIALFSSEMEYGINLTEIADRLGLSISHLRRLFHRVKGSSPRVILEEIRMKRAHELCLYTAYSFGDIAGACGFAEQSSFSKAFCRYWNRTPSEARKLGISNI
ncbi:MAG: helix-turn-helix transcriptional regulator [Spirochaetales bacterium]|nr:helix-turn-helix transcriptional regulator [Spirochaetales bacterium]